MQGLGRDALAPGVDTLIDRCQVITRDLLALALDSLRTAGDLPLTHMRLLFAVHDSGDSSCVTLAERLGISASSVTRQADRLVTSGHLARGTDPTNRSIVVLALTGRGQQALDQVLRARAHVFLELIDSLDDQKRAALAEALDLLHGHLDVRQ